MTKSETCLRPGCTTKLATIGVCTSCANDGRWKPKRDGVEIELPGETLQTDGAKANPSTGTAGHNYSNL